MNPTARTAASLLFLFSLTAPAQSPIEPIKAPSTKPIPSAIELGGDFTFRVCVRMAGAPKDLPLIAAGCHCLQGATR